MSLPTHPHPPPASHPALRLLAALAAPGLPECSPPPSHSPPVPHTMPSNPTLLSPASTVSPTLHCPPTPHWCALPSQHLLLPLHPAPLPLRGLWVQARGTPRKGTILFCFRKKAWVMGHGSQVGGQRFLDRHASCLHGCRNPLLPPQRVRGPPHGTRARHGTDYDGPRNLRP